MKKNNSTIKKETIEEVKNPTKKDKLANLDWRMKIRLAVITGAKVKCENEEQTQYHKLLLEKKKKYEEKVKMLEKKKQDKINEIKLNADAQVERILDSMITKEQKDIDLQAAEDRAKEKAEAKIKEKIEAKAKRRSDMHKSIPTQEIIKEHKRQQDFLAEAHAVKREEIEARLEAKAKLIEKAQKERAKKKEEIKAKKRKKRGKGEVEQTKITRKRKRPEERSTKEQRIEAIKEDKKKRYEAYLKELQLRASEKSADPKAFEENKAKRKEAEAQRLIRIADKRKQRKDKLIAVDLAQKEKTRKDLERWKESEIRRLNKKVLKSAVYLTKGGKEIPKVKNKVETRVGDTSRLAKIKTTELKQYAVVIGNLTDQNNIVDTLPHIIKCLPKTLNNHVKGFHEEMMKAHKDIYVGTFVYPINDMSHCIFEMINSDRLTINGKLTSRLAAQKEETIKKLSAA